MMKNQEMKSRIGEDLVAIYYCAILLNQRSRKRALPHSATQCHLSPSSKLRNGKTNSSVSKMNKTGEKVDSFAKGIREHVKLRPKITDTVKGKLILGAKLVHAGGVKKVFKNKFSVRDDEKLLNAFQCYLSTTSGPMPGLLFVSTHKLAFLKMKQNQTIKSRIESQVPINWALLLNQSSRKWALPDSATQCHLSLSSKPSKTRNGKTSTSLKITDSVKGKLILGAKLLRAGGVQKVFKKNFGVREGEKLLKASQCCLSTTAGPLPGLLFVSTEKVAFLSERSIRVPSSSGKSKKMHYKVLIPIAKIKTANESKNLKNPSEKYVQVVTEDHFEFWFMWFQQHQRTLKYLQDAISQSAQ
nr:GEM-like protein 4 [Ipomoea batatas]